MHFYIFILLILEEKILVIGRENDTISKIIINFISLLYPLNWIHTSISIMSAEMARLLSAFLPFFNGMNIDLYKGFRKDGLEETGQIFIVDIDENKIVINNNLKKGKKKEDIYNYLNNTFGPFPKNIKDIFIRELTKIKDDFEKRPNHNNDKKDLNIRIKNLFLYTVVLLLFGYEKYIHVVDDFPVFNIDTFVNVKLNEEKNFYDIFANTQIFTFFIEHTNEQKYFDDYNQQYQELKKKENDEKNIFPILLEKFQKKYLDNFEIKKKIFIEEKILKELNLFDSSSFALYRDVDLKKYKYSSKLGILRENKRITEYLITLNNKNDPKNYNKFSITEDETKNEKVINSKLSIGKSLSNNKRLKIISEKDEKAENIRCPSYINIIESNLTEDEKEEILDGIRAIIRRVYKNKEIIEKDQETIFNFLKSKFGRDYFINTLYTGFKKDGFKKVLGNKSFRVLKKIIYYLLVLIEIKKDNSDIKNLVKILKFCLYHITNIEKKEISLCDELFKLLDNYTIFNLNKFCTAWIEDDMNENDIKIFKKIESKDKSYKKSDNYNLYITHSLSIINQLKSIILKMKLTNDYDFILETFYDLARKYIPDDKLLIQIANEFYLELILYDELKTKKNK